MIGGKDDETLAALLAQCLAAQEANEPLDLAALCGERTDLVPQLAQSLGLSAQLPALHQNSVAGDVATTGILAGRYRLLAPIGRGASGTVYRAHDERLQREVAVKLLHPGLFGDGPARARFQREALALAAHEHPHIVRVHDQGRTADGTTFLVTELLRGHSLQAILDAAKAAMPDGPSAAAFARLDWLQTLLPDAHLETTWLRQLTAWVADLGDGLAAAHAQGICHRDVKPSNAFVDRDGRIVLLDFGIAARSGDPAITHAHAVLGTPCYMAPEQARGEHDPRPALDVYGLAATLYHLLTHRPPHAGDLQQVLLALRDQEPTPVQQLHRGLPRDLRAIVEHGLMRDPRHRYATMALLVGDLRAFLQHQPVKARPLGPLGRSWRRIARRPARALAVAASALAVVLLLTAMPAWAGLSARERAERRLALLIRLPADVCIEGRPEQRPLVPLHEHASLLGELEALLDLDADDLGVRLLLAASRLDRGDGPRARADIEAIQARADTPYLRALATRYGAATRDADGAWRVDLQGLPAPESTADCFVAGFHALRDRDCDRADELLTRAASYLPARDLRLLAILGKSKPEPDRALAEAKELEGIYGRPTARTQHTLAAAMLQRREYEQAIPYAEGALRLRPDRHGPWNNLGLAHLRLGRLQAARDCYERAVALRPWFDNSLSGLCQTWRRLGDFAAARAAAQRIGDVGWREHELGNVELAVAMQALAAGDLPARMAAAAAARTHFAAAKACPATTNPRANGLDAANTTAAALADDDVNLVLVALLTELRQDPRHPTLISNLACLLAQAELDSTSLLRLRLWLHELAVDLAPADPNRRRQRDDFVRSLSHPR